MRAKKCKSCGVKFVPKRSTLEQVCSLPCAIALAKEKEKKKRKAETRKMKLEIRSQSDWINAIQPKFNRLIREIDKFQPCISSGNAWINNGMDSGHYYPRSTHGRLRFHFLNVWAESKNSNGFDTSHLIGYRKNLIALFGEKVYQEIEELPQTYPFVKWGIPQLREAEELIKQFKKEAETMPILKPLERLEVRREFMKRFNLY